MKPSTLRPSFSFLLLVFMWLELVVNVCVPIWMVHVHCWELDVRPAQNQANSHEKVCSMKCMKTRWRCSNVLSRWLCHCKMSKDGTNMWHGDGLDVHCFHSLISILVSFVWFCMHNCTATQNTNSSSSKPLAHYSPPLLWGRGIDVREE